MFWRKRLADPKPRCPSCNGTGWVVVRADNITFASGPCRCVGGHTWLRPGREEKKEDSSSSLYARDEGRAA